MSSSRMGRSMCRLLAGLAACGWLLGVPAGPVSAEEAKPPPAPAKKAAEHEPAKTVQYRPPDWKAPKTRVAAATRGLEDPGPYLTLLVPERTGYTSEASPTLYWYVSERFAGPVQVTLLKERAIEPVLEMRLEHGVEAGVHAIPLRAYKVVLEPGVDYEWSVTLTVDPNRPSTDSFASGTIRRVPQAALPRAVAGADELAALAAHGLWYDAVDLSSRLIQAHPEDVAWRELRAELLEQEGLEEPAAWDRTLAGLQ